MSERRAKGFEPLRDAIARLMKALPSQGVGSKMERPDERAESPDPRPAPPHGRRV